MMIFQNPGTIWRGYSVSNFMGYYKDYYILEDFEKSGNFEYGIISFDSEDLLVDLSLPEYPDLKLRQEIESYGEIYFDYMMGKILKSRVTVRTYVDLPESSMETEMTEYMEHKDLFSLDISEIKKRKKKKENSLQKKLFSSGFCF